MEFQMQQGDFRELEKGDRGMLIREIGIYVTKNINLKVKHRRKKNVK